MHLVQRPVAKRFRSNIALKQSFEFDLNGMCLMTLSLRFYGAKVVQMFTWLENIFCISAPATHLDRSFRYS